MAQQVIVKEAFEVIVPATVLESRLLSGGPVVSTIECPEKVISYKYGQVLNFSKKKDAMGFISKHGNKVQLWKKNELYTQIMGTFKDES